MKTFDPFLFLIGNRAAILRIASSPWALLIGAIYVYTAGIARHYDFHPLHIETKWLWAPFCIVFVSSFLIFRFMYAGYYTNDGTDNRKPFWTQYLSFLGLFLMTAPIAWLYAIPIETFWPGQPVACAKFNITLLAIVSFWRVALMALVVRVVTGVNWLFAISCILGPACVETFFGATTKNLDIVGLMGGVELSPTEEFLKQAYAAITLWSFWISLVMLIFFFIARASKKSYRTFDFKKSAMPTRSLGLSIAILVVWIGIALPFQLNDKRRQPRIQLEKMAKQRPTRDITPAAPLIEIPIQQKPK